MSFLKELKRRNVYRVAGIYIIVAWMVLQVVDVFMDFMPLPEWTGSLVFVLLAAGFPVALIMAWAFELTPEGIRPESNSSPTSKRSSKRRKWDLLLVTGVSVVIAWWAYGKFQSPGVNEPKAELEIRSLVVLPLDNLMSDPDQAYFVEGMHDALITELSQIDALRIISRTSAMRYQDSDKALPEIARELGVDAVVEGSVLRAGDTVRINVQLIRADTDEHIWGEQFDRELTDILGLYTDVTQRITERVRVQVTSDETAPLNAVKPVQPDVYDLYLKGSHLCNRWAPQDMLMGLDYLRQATSMEPENAQYHARLATCLQYTAYFDYIAAVSIRVEALTAANNAVVLDPTLGFAHVAKAAVHWYLDFDAQSAEQSLRRALQLSPNLAPALIHFSWLMSELGQTESALDAAQRAILIDPFVPAAHQALGQVYFLNREFDLARKPFDTALSLDRGDPGFSSYSAWVLEQDGAYDEAIALCRTATEISGGAPLYLSELGYMLGINGQQDEALGVLEQLFQLQDDMSAQPLHFAKVYLGLGEYDQAIEWLEKAYDARNAGLAYIISSVQYDPLRPYPRFQALVNKIIN